MTDHALPTYPVPCHICGAIVQRGRKGRTNAVCFDCKKELEKERWAKMKEVKARKKDNSPNEGPA